MNTALQFIRRYSIETFLLALAVACAVAAFLHVAPLGQIAGGFLALAVLGLVIWLGVEACLLPRPRFHLGEPVQTPHGPGKVLSVFEHDEPLYLVAVGGAEHFYPQRELRTK